MTFGLLFLKVYFLISLKVIVEQTHTHKFTHTYRYLNTICYPNVCNAQIWNGPNLKTQNFSQGSQVCIRDPNSGASTCWFPIIHQKEAKLETRDLTIVTPIQGTIKQTDVLHITPNPSSCSALISKYEKIATSSCVMPTLFIVVLGILEFHLICH